MSLKNPDKAGIAAQLITKRQYNCYYYNII
jgi:hypothetical protein